jgi:capsular exopolysaccharide synthesis family protein
MHYALCSCIKESMATTTLVTITDPRSAVSEAYRTLRTNLQFAAVGGGLHTLVVTTPSPNEGKSTTVANLAVAFAQGGKKVIVVDADLRRPALHELFGVTATSGLSNALLDAALIANPPLVAVNGVEGLRLLPAGAIPPNPAELLGSAELEQLITRLKAMADIVLFDAPPILPVTDAAILAKRTDGILLVLQAGKTKREHAARAKSLLEQVGARIVGTALTNAKVDSGVGGY